MTRRPSILSAQRDVAKNILGPWSPEFSTCVVHGINGTPSSGAWASANDPVAIPFRLSTGATLVQLWIGNGSAAGGNFDIGVYDSAWVRLVSSGSTVGSGNTQPQYADVTDTALAGGQLYYLVAARDNTTANRQRFFTAGSTQGIQLCGVQDSATDAFPLPNPLTNMAVTTTLTIVPMMGVAFRAPF